MRFNAPAGSSSRYLNHEREMVGDDSCQTQKITARCEARRHSLSYG
jgi:hypothetical protein